MWRQSKSNIQHKQLLLHQCILVSHAASNCVGKIGQQLERPGGDKEWITRLVEEVIRADPKYIDFFSSWFQEMKYILTVYEVKLKRPANEGRVALANMLRNKERNDFLRLWNDIQSKSTISPIKQLVLDLNQVEAEVVVDIVGCMAWNFEWEQPVGEEETSNRYDRVWWRRT